MNRHIKKQRSDRPLRGPFPGRRASKGKCELAPLPSITEMTPELVKLAHIPVEDLKQKIAEQGVIMLPSTVTFIQEMIKGKNQIEAGKIAGFTRPLTRANIRNALLAALSLSGIDESTIAHTLASGLKATKLISAMIGGDANGKTVDYIEVPDWTARARFLDMILKVRGDYAAKQAEQHTGSQALEFKVNTDYEELRALIARRTGELG